MSGRAKRPEAPYRLVIVDDSPLYRLRFARLFGRSGEVVVAGVAADGEEGVQTIANVRPDVVLLDLTMPKMDGFAVLRWIMSRDPVPVVVCSSRGDREAVFLALELGAVDFISEPETGREGQAVLEQMLVERVVGAARARLGPHKAESAKLPRFKPAAPAEVIAIGASAGGPAALQTLVRALPPSLELPILVAQHMPRGFTRLFAERLARYSGYAAVEAKTNARIEPRTIYVAPGGQQTRVAGDAGARHLEVAPRADGDAHAPSVDVLLESVAAAYGPAAVAVILTGMGDDGSAGAVAVKSRGGTVLAESSDSALIFGMPRAAIATGRVDAQLPLSLLPEAFLALARHGRP
jgi:two-component system chemotaxis response regulator CheB